MRKQGREYTEEQKERAVNSMLLRKGSVSFRRIADEPYYIGVFSGGSIKLENTAKALSTFICEYGMKDKLIILDPGEIAVLETNGIWIDQICDPEFRLELLKTLNPMIRKLLKKWGLPEVPFLVFTVGETKQDNGKRIKQQ